MSPQFAPINGVRKIYKSQHGTAVFFFTVLISALALDRYDQHKVPPSGQPNPNDTDSVAFAE